MPTALKKSPPKTAPAGTSKASASATHHATHPTWVDMIKVRLAPTANLISNSER